MAAPTRTTPESRERRSLLQSQIRSQVRGLLLIAAAAILFAILRAGLHRVFGPGWWRLW